MGKKNYIIILNKKAGDKMKYYFGVDVGGMSVKGGVVDEDGKVLFKHTCKVDSDAIYSVDNVVCALKEFTKNKEIIVKKCGIGVPCIFDKSTGVVSYGNNLDFKGVNLKEHFLKKFDLELEIANDATTAGLGEAKFGAGKDYSNSVLITIGTGIGCGIILDKKPILSNSSAVGELSHTTIVVNGRKCTCGNRGCLEAYCSMTALYKDIKREMLKNRQSILWEYLNVNDIDGRVFFSLIEKDSLARKIYQRFINYLKICVTNVANLLRPDVIIIGGGVSAQGDVIIKPLNEHLKEHVFAPEYTAKIPVVSAKNGNDAGIIGSACLVM
ncbi:MAG: ROK family protein [Clostridiales bacterium]|nr:ROK family protein [Clostridiales bacterium]